MSTPAVGSCASQSAAARAAGAQMAGGWGRPWSHIGAATTWSGPSTSRSAHRSWEMRVWSWARQFTTWVTPASGSLRTASPTGTLPMAMRSPRTHDRPSRPRWGP